MVGHLWTEDEKDVFLHYIIPKSQYAMGSFDPSAGMSWKELAPLMQAEMSRLGDNRRGYSETVLSQRHYKYLSAHSLSKGEGHVPVSSAVPRQHTQTDPKEFAGLSAEEALSVHANNVGMTEHDLVPKTSRSRVDEQRKQQPKHEIGAYQRDNGENLGDRKRRFADYKEDDEGFMIKHDHQNSRPSGGEVEDDTQRQGGKPRFVLDTMDTSNESDGDHFQKPFIAPATETEAEVRARLDAEEKQLRIEGEERRKRRKTGHTKVEIGRSSTDGESEVMPTEPALPHPSMNTDISIRGTFVDGIYYPAHRAFSFAPELGQIVPAPLSDGFDQGSEVSSQLSSPLIRAQKSSTLGAKKKERKSAPPSPAKSPYLSKTKKIVSKMTNKLQETSSKHPIPFTSRPVPLFSSMKLPKILKKPGSAKPVLKKNAANKYQADDNRGGQELDSRDGAVKPFTQGRPKKSPITEDKGQPVEKTFNISGMTYKLSELPQAVKRAFGIDNEGNLLAPSRSSNNAGPAAAAPAHDQTQAYKPSVSMTPKMGSAASSFNSPYTDKYSVPRSNIEVPDVDTMPEDAAPWAKEIAAKYGYRDAVAVVGHGDDVEEVEDLGEIRCFGEQEIAEDVEDQEE
ncbi:hypothetical protein VTL71DRAFT_698 [Oculimacula yallundae]|uniref:Myb-like domain-containing protein n=1 Tax=Oculimacula yallundae TaxID=86028 RepID=A0ABR4D0Y8_9HELO